MRDPFPHRPERPERPERPAPAPRFYITTFEAGIILFAVVVFIAAVLS